MFTRQISSIIGRLIGAGMPREQTNAISEFGNCAAPLEHRAPLKLTSSADAAPTVPISALDVTDIPNDYTATTGTVYSTLTVVNGDSQIGSGNTTVEGGYAGVFIGVVNITDLIVNGMLILGSTAIDTSLVTTATPITSIRYDPASHKFQYKKTTITVLKAAAEDTTWTDFHTAVFLDRLVNNVNYSTSTHILSQRDTASVYVLETGTETTARNVNTAVACGS